MEKGGIPQNICNDIRINVILGRIFLQSNLLYCILEKKNCTIKSDGHHNNTYIGHKNLCKSRSKGQLRL